MTQKTWNANKIYVNVNVSFEVGTDKISGF